jgi:LysM repeat protein
MSKWISLWRLAGWLLVASALLWCSLTSPAFAAPLYQMTPFPTPTPGPDGRIIYIVQPGDTLWRVSAITGVSLDQLRALNKLGADEPIVPGQQLLLGLAGPAEAATPTFGPTFTPEPLQPTPSAQPGSGTLCILVFNDQNGDSLRQEEEPSIPSGEISVTDRAGKVSLTETTTTESTPHCFQELPEGEYNVSVAVPAGFNPTTVMNYAIKVEPGAETYLDFGAQPDSEQLAVAPPPTGSGNSPLWGILGGLLILFGVGLGIFASRLLKAR